MRVTVRLLGGSHRSGGKLYADGDEFEVSQRESEAFADKLTAIGAVAPAAPEAGSAEHYASLSVPKVIEAVKAGVFTPEQALEFEALSGKPRAGVLKEFASAGDEKQPDGGDSGSEQSEGEATNEDPTGQTE